MMRWDKSQRVVYGAVTAACWAVAYAGPPPCRADGEIKIFTSRYPEAGRKLEQAYGRVALKLTESRTDDDGKFDGKHRGEMDRDDGQVLYDRTVLDPGISPMQAGTRAVMGGSKEEFFEGYRRPGDARFVYTSLGPRNDFDHRARLILLPCYAPYSTLETSVNDYLGTEGVSVASAAEKVDGGARVVAVRLEEAVTPANLADFAKDVRPDGSKFEVGSVFETYDLEFDAKSWAILSLRFSFTATPTDEICERIEYERGSDPPRVKSLDFWYGNPTSGAKHGERNEVISDLSFGPIPSKKFDPGSLDLDAAVSAAPASPGGGTSGGLPASRLATPPGAGVTAAEVPVSPVRNEPVAGRGLLWLYAGAVAALIAAGIVFLKLAGGPRKQ